VSWRESAAERARARAEQPVVVRAPAGRLYGILTPAAGDAGPCVVMFTRPRSHRNRMFVELARRLAAGGFPSFRFDYHGCGDSSGAGGFLDPGQPYQDDALAVLRTLHDDLGQRRFVLVGSCFDARTALSAFDGAAAWIEGVAFMAAPLMELATLTDAHTERKDWKHVWKALHNADNWRTLGNPERWRHMSRVLGRVAGRSLGAPGGQLALSPGFVRHFQCLARSGARALFLYGELDAETVSYRVAERTLFARLDPAARARMTFEVWPGAVHSFLEVGRQREVLDRITGWIAAGHDDGGPPVNGRGAVRRTA
jgi:alpha/beta superfamily hydrolase